MQDTHPDQIDLYSKFDGRKLTVRYDPYYVPDHRIEVLWPTGDDPALDWDFSEISIADAKKLREWLKKAIAHAEQESN